MELRVKSWTHDAAPSAAAAAQLLIAEGLRPSEWSNGPGDTYAEHAHSYHKVLCCVEGAIRFTLPDGGPGAGVELGPGDRMELPAGTRHGAVVGPHGCRCVEAAQIPGAPRDPAP
jgi:quercetin dioxygenase-like cupin family protein